MGEAPDRIVEEIDHARSDLGRDLTAFEAQLKQETSWEVQFRRHSLLFLGVAVLIGFAISKLVDRQ